MIAVLRCVVRATDMQRREFITILASAVAARPVIAEAQAPDRMRYIAWLGLGHAGTPSPYLESLRTGLRELGWIEGRNLKIVAFWATGREDMEGVAREVLASDPDVIVTQELMAIAMRNLQSTKPVALAVIRWTANSSKVGRGQVAI